MRHRSPSAWASSPRGRCLSQHPRRCRCGLSLRVVTPPARPTDLDAPLPARLAGSHQGWFTRYRRYPVFSRRWARGRLQTLGLVVVLAYLSAMAPAVLFTRHPELPTPLGGLMQVAIGVFLPLWAGPWLTSRVRARGWAPQREWAGLVTVLAALVLAMLAFHKWGAEPVKQFIAEQVGAVDEKGQRKRMVMSFGLIVSDGEKDPPRLPQPEQSLPDRIANATTTALFTFWIAGGAGLWAWRRERAGLAALAQEEALQQAQAQRREAELRLSVLAAQVEPHFLFNTLAGVRSAISTDPARASEMVERLVDYLRAAIPRLRSDGEVQATLGAQLDIVRAYLGLMATRMPRLQWQVQAPPELLDVRCPPLMLISLAENAVKHGVENKVGPACVELLAETVVPTAGKPLLAVTVQDDGPGFQPTAAGHGAGLGLVNIRERLAQLYPGPPEGVGLVLRARPEGGVAATLTVPLVHTTPT